MVDRLHISNHRLNWPTKIYRHEYLHTHEEGRVMTLALGVSKDLSAGRLLEAICEDFLFIPSHSKDRSNLLQPEISEIGMLKLKVHRKVLSTNKYTV